MQLATRIAAVVATLALTAGIAAAQNVSVTVNGQPTSLNPAPIERAGRVFVPLRGVFEHLGASVVYANGQINAQGNGRSVSLHIGSTQATVNGQSQMLDVAPFIIGASTYVPLRFVAQALGAQVNWDNSNRVVAIVTGGAPAPAAVAPQPPAQSALRLSNVTPARGSAVSSTRPTIEATFTGATADPNSLKIALDSLDVTGETSRSPSGIVFSPPSDLQSMEHTVRISGKDSNGVAFERGWSFTSGTSHLTNYIQNLSPAEGAAIPPTFTVSGRTLPNSSIQIDAGAATNIGGVFSFGGDHERIMATADANGNFSQTVNLNAAPGQTVNLVVTSTEPTTKSSVRVMRHDVIR
jgi:copper amine oxidase-like protein